MIQDVGSGLTFVVIDVVVTFHFKPYAAIPTGPSGRAFATVLAVLQRAQSVAAASIFAPSYLNRKVDVNCQLIELIIKESVSSTDSYRRILIAR